MGAMNHVNLVAGLALSLTVLGAYGAESIFPRAQSENYCRGAEMETGTSTRTRACPLDRRLNQTRAVRREGQISRKFQC